MTPKSNYKQFVSQFSLPEWKQLCKHRLFLHFLKTNMKIAASIAADALQRPIRYRFPSEEPAPKKTRTPKASSRRSSSANLRHRRFRF
jgi:hypothetical protein